MLPRGPGCAAAPRDRPPPGWLKVEEDPKAAQRSRVGVLLANRNFDQSRTITHVIRMMLAVLPEDAVQLPHRQESVALDYIIDCQPGCYTLSDTGTPLKAGRSLTLQTGKEEKSVQLDSGVGRQ